MAERFGIEISGFASYNIPRSVYCCRQEGFWKISFNLSCANNFISGHLIFGKLVAADGGRAIGQFVPTIEVLPCGGFFSQDGTIWNFAGTIKEDGTGYITEYALKKSELRNPIDISKIGFVLSTNDAVSSKVRESRYAWWRINADGEGVESYNLPRNWGILTLRADTMVSEWALF